MKSIYLSYFLNEQTPLYGGEKVIEIKKRSEISQGASSNTEIIKFPNHSGTHIDFPKHFADSGKTINDYPSSFWQFENVHVISFPCKKDEIIKEDVLNINNIPRETDFIIINTGFGKNRTNDIYWNNNPGLSPSLAFALKKRCPNIKIVGFDFISVSSFQNRLLGREAHREFLVNHDILLIEDMKLDEIKQITINSITALPLLIDKTDGSPISIIANYE
jgi:arylformamidase